MDEDSLLSKIINQDDVYGEDSKRDFQTRGDKYKFDRLDMAAHFEMCRKTGGFGGRYHMSEEAFLHIL